MMPTPWSKIIYRRVPAILCRQFSNSHVLGTVEVKKLGVVGAGQMVSWAV
jgi:hypothetical protein